MIKSMTGYGKAFADVPGKKYLIEIKTLNSKQLDLGLKIPGTFREQETEIRNLVTQTLERGKIDVFISLDSSVTVQNYSINTELARKYFEELHDLQSGFGEDNATELLPLVLKMPDVIRSGRDTLEPEEWMIIREALIKAITDTDTFRINEGQVLVLDILSRVQLILVLLDSIGPFEQKRINSLRDKIRRNFSEFIENEMKSVSVDENRFEQELIYYLEKMDITEEKVRLRKHCDYFLETMKESSSPGKKLGFISQEMGREINTIGSKASDADIQKIVVQMKDELEKIKEQLLNIL